MAEDGVFEIIGTYDEDAGHFLDEDGNQSFTLNDEHGLVHDEGFTLTLANDRLLKVWKAMGVADSLGREFEESRVTVNVFMDVIESDGDMHCRYGRAIASDDSVTFEAQDKNSGIVVETRAINLSEIEAHLLAAGLIDRSECRSYVAAGSPAP